MRVTISDVARYAGVNKATVSRALRGDPKISSATRERVWEAARKLGYEPDAGAKALSGNRTGMVAAVFRGLEEKWTGTFMAGLERVLSRHNKDLIVKSTGGDLRQSFNVMRSLRSRRVEGIIWLDEIYPDDLSGDIPVVYVGSNKKGSNTITPDTQVLISELENTGWQKGLTIAIPQRGILSIMHESINALKERYGNKIHLTDQVPGQNGLSGSCILVCIDIDNYPKYSYRLKLPFFEMGAIAGRIHLNSLLSRGVRPTTVLVKPVIFRS